MAPRKKQEETLVAPERIQVYTDPEFWHEAEKQRRVRDQEIAQEQGPGGRSLSMSSFVVMVLFQSFKAMREYRKHNDDGWNGFWKLVHDSVGNTSPKKKGRRS